MNKTIDELNEITTLSPDTFVPVSAGGGRQLSMTSLL